MMRKTPSNVCRLKLTETLKKHASDLKERGKKK